MRCIVISGQKKLLLASVVVFLVVIGMAIGNPVALGNIVMVGPEVLNFCPTCKDHAYVGLDHQDYLTLYDGHPKSGKVIRRLFQLDMESAENGMPPQSLDQLLQGIHVTDMEEFNSVLSSYSDHAQDHN